MLDIDPRTLLTMLVAPSAFLTIFAMLLTWALWTIHHYDGRNDGRPD